MKKNQGKKTRRKLKWLLRTLAGRQDEGIEEGTKLAKGARTMSPKVRPQQVEKSRPGKHL